MKHDYNSFLSSSNLIEDNMIQLQLIANTHGCFSSPSECDWTCCIDGTLCAAAVTEVREFNRLCAFMCTCQIIICCLLVGCAWTSIFCSWGFWRSVEKTYTLEQQTQLLYIWICNTEGVGRLKVVGDHPHHRLTEPMVPNYQPMIISQCKLIVQIARTPNSR